MERRHAHQRGVVRLTEIPKAQEPEEADHALGLGDDAVARLEQIGDAGEGNAGDLERFVGVLFGSHWGAAGGKDERGDLVGEAWAQVGSGEVDEVARCMTGFLPQLAAGGRFDRLTGVDEAGREFDEVLVGGVAPLADEQDVIVGGDRDDDDRGGTFGDVAVADGARGLDDVVFPHRDPRRVVHAVGAGGGGVGWFGAEGGVPAHEGVDSAENENDT